MLWNIIFYGICVVALLTVFFTCVLVCIKLCRPEIEIIVDEEDDDVEFFAVPRRLLEDMEPSFKTAHITRDSLRYDSSEEHSYVGMDLYDNRLSSSDSLTSGKGNTTDDHTDSNPVEDAVKTDENDNVSVAQDDTRIKSNAEDHKPTNPKGKSGDN